MRSFLLASLTFAVGIVPLEAQGVGVAAHVGTLGFGVDVGVSAGSRLGFRGGANFFPTDIDANASDVDYTVDLPSPQFTLMADLYLVGGLRVSGGLFSSADDVSAQGVLTENVEIGNGVYTPAQVGTLRGSIVNNDLGPYLGIGFGNPAASTIGFFLDLGVGFQGKPDVILGVDGPVANLPGFQQDLRAEEISAEEEIEFFQYYPIISIGLSIRLKQ